MTTYEEFYGMPDDGLKNQKLGTLIRVSRLILQRMVKEPCEINDLFFNISQQSELGDISKEEFNRLLYAFADKKYMREKITPSNQHLFGFFDIEMKDSYVNDYLPHVRNISSSIGREDSIASISEIYYDYIIGKCSIEEARKKSASGIDKRD